MLVLFDAIFKTISPLGEIKNVKEIDDEIKILSGFKC
jgi:hypothetical protein